MVHAGTQAKIEGLVMDLAGTRSPPRPSPSPRPKFRRFKKVITTDENGEFKTLILDATRDYNFLIEAEGFQPMESPFKVGAGSTDNFFEFNLQSDDQAAAARGIQATRATGIQGAGGRQER